MISRKSLYTKWYDGEWHIKAKGWFVSLLLYLSSNLSCNLLDVGMCCPPTHSPTQTHTPHSPHTHFEVGTSWVVAGSLRAHVPSETTHSETAMLCVNVPFKDFHHQPALLWQRQELNLWVSAHYAPYSVVIGYFKDFNHQSALLCQWQELKLWLVAHYAPCSVVTFLLSISTINLPSCGSDKN